MPLAGYDGPGLIARFAPIFALTGLACAASAWSAPPIPTPIGVTRAYRLPATSETVRAARPVGGFTCARASPIRLRVHLELFARKLVLLVPSGIGVAPPARRDGAYVAGGRCVYPLRTREPTGVVEAASAGLRLGDLFGIWGQPLAPRRLASFRSSHPLLAFVDGKRFHGDPRTIPLRRHDEIVLEIGGYVPPHSSYLFPSHSS